jgi:hypothetical protein
VSSSQPLQWMRSAAPDGGGRQATAPCAMCGIELPTGAMLPDGGQACADVRWYCRDTAACTKRWTERQPAPMLLSRREPAGGQPRRGEPGHEWAEGQADGQTGHAEPGHEWAGGPDGGQTGHAEPGHEWAGGPLTGTPGGD